jgi:hypothetical protein
MLADTRLRNVLPAVNTKIPFSLEYRGFVFAYVTFLILDRSTFSFVLVHRNIFVLYLICEPHVGNIDHWGHQTEISADYWKGKYSNPRKSG